jgi:signal peptidase II
MIKKIALFLIAAFLTFVIDQAIKQLFLNGFVYENSCITLSLVYNKGVAFSMLSFLGENLKYLQSIILLTIALFFIFEKKIFDRFFIFVGVLIGAGVSNLIDRFIHGGVVDFFYWHCGFDFAIFNFADVMIDISVGVIILFSLLETKKQKN